jgi:hypothetical protein
MSAETTAEIKKECYQMLAEYHLKQIEQEMSGLTMDDPEYVVLEGEARLHQTHLWPTHLTKLKGYDNEHIDRPS